MSRAQYPDHRVLFSGVGFPQQDTRAWRPARNIIVAGKKLAKSRPQSDEPEPQGLEIGPRLSRSPCPLSRDPVGTGQPSLQTEIGTASRGTPHFPPRPEEAVYRSPGQQPIGAKLSSPDGARARLGGRAILWPTAMASEPWEDEMARAWELSPSGAASVAMTFREPDVAPNGACP